MSRERRPKEPYPYLILDTRDEKVREAGIITSQAIPIAIGVDWEGRRQVLSVDLANRESVSRWKDFLQALKDRGLHGVAFVVFDDHPGLKKAVAQVRGFLAALLRPLPAECPRLCPAQGR